jgi:hypothetical protein
MTPYSMHAWFAWLPLLVLFAVVFRVRRHALGLRAFRWDDRRRTGPSPVAIDDAVRARLELVEQLETRVSELENRLDFTERLLAQRAAADPAAGVP